MPLPILIIDGYIYRHVGSVPKERERKMDSFNKFGVCLKGERLFIMFHGALTSGLTRDEALILAAWLAEMAEALPGDFKFEKAVRAVRGIE